METEGALGTVATGLEKNLRNAKATVMALLRTT